MIDECDKKIMSYDELRALISINIAATPKIVDNAMRLLGISGLIKDIGSARFELIKNDK